MTNRFYFVLPVYLLLVCPFRGLGQWSQENLPEFKFYVQATGTDHKVAFVGGLRSNLNSSGGLDILDLDSHTWLHQDLFTGVTLTGTATAGDKLFIGGGVKITGGIGVPQSLVQIFNFADSLWDYDQLSEPRSNLSAVACLNKVFFAGGDNSTGTPGPFNVFDVVDVYNLDTDSWDTLHLSEARTGMGAVQFDSTIVFGGGETNMAYSSRVDIYNVGTKQWTQAMLSSPRTFPSAAVVGKYVLFAGGYGDDGPSNVVDIWDTESGVWWADTLSLPRFLMTAGTIGSRAYFAGGGGLDEVNSFLNSSTSRVDVFDGETLNWSAMEMPTARTAVLGTAVCNKLYVPAGWSPEANVLRRTIDIFTEADFNCISAANEPSFQSLRVFPNPARNMVFLNDTNTEWEKIELVNVPGQVIPLSLSGSAGQIILPDVPPGFYFLQLTDSKTRGIFNIPLVID